MTASKIGIDNVGYPQSAWVGRGVADLRILTKCIFRKYAGIYGRQVSSGSMQAYTGDRCLQEVCGHIRTICVFRKYAGIYGRQVSSGSMQACTDDMCLQEVCRHIRTRCVFRKYAGMYGRYVSSGSMQGYTDWPERYVDRIYAPRKAVI